MIYDALLFALSGYIVWVATMFLLVLSLLLRARWRVKFFVKKEDLWVGMYYAKGKRYLYILPLPCLGVRLDLNKQEPTQEQKGSVANYLYSGVSVEGRARKDTTGRLTDVELHSLTLTFPQSPTCEEVAKSRPDTPMRLYISEGLIPLLSRWVGDIDLKVKLTNGFAQRIGQVLWMETRAGVDVEICFFGIPVFVDYDLNENCYQWVAKKSAG